MQISEEKFFEVVAGAMSGLLANPAHTALITDQYGMSQAMSAVLFSLRQAMCLAGITIIEPE